MSWLATPAKASRMMVARCTRRLATVVAVLNLRSTFSCRSLITTFAAEPAMATLLVFPHPGKSAESSKTLHPVRGRFRFPGLAYVRHPAVALEIASYHLGSSDQAAEHWLIIDR